MKSKELVYLASTAILLAATANVAKAEEHTIAESEVLKTERSVSSQNQAVNAAASQVSNQPTVAVSSAEQSVQAVKQEEQATNAVGTAVESVGGAQSATVETQVAPAKPEGQTQSEANASSQNETAADQSAKASSSVADSGIASEPKASPAVASAPKASNAGKTVFYNAGSKAQAARGNSQAEIKGTSFVDVSSHNGHISVDDYRKLAQQGVGGVVVKLTEGTHYTNPFAESQVRNAQGAGLQVSTYAFSHYTSDEEARAEARYYAAFANRLGLPKNTVMVNDMEDPKMQNGINQHTQAWADEMRRLGYSNLMYYTSASWLDQNNLRSKGPVNTSQFGYSNFWVAQYPSSNLNLDGAKSLKYNSGAGAWQFTAQAQLLAGKHVFDHSVDYTGRFTQQSALAKQPLKGNISIQNKNNINGSFDVVISNVSAPYGVSVVSVPVWSEANGQDDIIWYTATQQANGTYKVSVDSSRHKDSVGKYNVHLYYVRNDGQLVGVGGTTTNVSVIKPQGKISIQNRNSETGDFDIVVSGISSPGGLKTVSLPTWSEPNGQDDIKWYNAERQADGTYRKRVRISDHNNVQGEYNVHLYYVQNDGRLVGVSSTKTTVSLGKPKGTISIQNRNKETGDFDIVVSDIVSPGGLKGVSLPTWSEANGQDDIKWYNAERQPDGTYRKRVRVNDHKNVEGEYNIHLYYVQNDGKLVGAGGIKTNVSLGKPKGNISIQNKNNVNGSFDVVISNVSAPYEVSAVSVPVWSEANGQDDIIWYTATQQVNGTYKVTVESSKHKDSVGKYHIHLYYVRNDGQLVGVGGTTTNVSAVKPQGKISIQNRNSETGDFDIVVSDIVSPGGLKTVSLPTWSEANGQDDIKWYNAERQPDGTYRKRVRASDHNNVQGEYNVHLYYVQNDGKLVGAGGIKTNVSISKPQGKISIQNKNNDTGEFDIVVSGIVAPEGLKTVYLPTWSEANGQDDVQWYTADRQADGTYRKHVYARDHKNNAGEYNVHLYYLNNQNQLQGAGGEKTSISVNRPQAATNQRDRVLAAAAAMVGVKGGSAEHQRLVNDYNSVRPLPVGYAVKNTDDWCDIFTTVIFQREGLSDLIGRECGVERHIHIFQRLGIWNEDGNSTPSAGDIITFNWDKDTQQNDGWADHIGIVEKVENGIIHTIEGNSNNVVKRNTYRIGHGNIRGFATPRYK